MFAVCATFSVDHVTTLVKPERTKTFLNSYIEVDIFGPQFIVKPVHDRFTERALWSRLWLLVPEPEQSLFGPQWNLVECSNDVRVRECVNRCHWPELDVVKPVSLICFTDN